MEGSEEAAAARWRQCGRLVHAVRAGTQEKKFYDDSVKALRAQLRAEFEALLLDDYCYAQVWHCCPLFCKMFLNTPNKRIARCGHYGAVLFLDVRCPSEVCNQQLHWRDASASSEAMH